MAYDTNNIFAKILRGEIPCVKVFEDAGTLAFMDVMPEAEGHVLVLPKEAARDILDLSAEALLVEAARFARAGRKRGMSLASTFAGTFAPKHLRQRRRRIAENFKEIVDRDNEDDAFPMNVDRPRPSSQSVDNHCQQELPGSSDGYCISGHLAHDGLDCTFPVANHLGLQSFDDELPGHLGR